MVMNSQSGFVEVNATRLYYEVASEENIVVLIHVGSTVECLIIVGVRAIEKHRQ